MKNNSYKRGNKKYSFLIYEDKCPTNWKKDRSRYGRHVLKNELKKELKENT